MRQKDWYVSFIAAIPPVPERYQNERKNSIPEEKFSDADRILPIIYIASYGIHLRYA